MTYPVTQSRRRLHRATIVVLVALAAVAMHAVITSTGVDLVVGESTRRTVTGGAAAGAALVAGLLGWALLALLERFSRRPERTWTSVAGGVLALSLGGPVIAGASGSALLGLLALHLVVGGLLVVLLPRTARASRQLSGTRRDPDPERAAHSLQ